MTEDANKAMVKAYVHGIKLPDKDDFDSREAYKAALQELRINVESAIAKGVQESDIEADRAETYDEFFAEDAEEGSGGTQE